jgi:hypothetical protein
MSSPLVRSTEIEHREAPWLEAWVRSSSSYGALNEAWFLPTQSRLLEKLVLRTYHSEDGPREVGDGEAGRAVFNGGGDGVQWHSSTKGSSDSDGVGGGSSSKRRIGMGGSSAAARWRQNGLAMAARVWVEFMRDRALLIGVLIPNHRRQKC